MKRRFLVFVTLSTLLVSCRKRYTCECYTTLVFQYQGGYASIVLPASKSAYTAKLTEKQARAACQHEEAAVESSYTNAETNNGNNPLQPGESVKTSCGLK